MSSKKHTIAMILTAALALTLLLTACGNGSDTPAGDNLAPGVTEPPDNTQRDTTAPTPGGDDIDTSDGVDPNESGNPGTPSNFTGKSKFSPEDLEEWGLPKGIDVYELRDKGYTKEIPGSIPSIEDYLKDMKTNPDWYPSGGMVFNEDPTIWVRSDDLLIDDVYIYETDTALGPRGLAIGMTPEQVINLFYCENAVAYEYVKNPSPDLLPPLKEGYYATLLDLYPGWEDNGSISILENGQIANMRYEILWHAYMEIDFTDNKVSEIRVQYNYTSL